MHTQIPKAQKQLTHLDSIFCAFGICVRVKAVCKMLMKSTMHAHLVVLPWFAFCYYVYMYTLTDILDILFKS